MIMARKVTTLFIRDDAVNLLVVDGKRVDKWASAPLEAGLVSQGLVLDEARVAEKLKELFKLEKITMGRVIAGLSGHNSVYLFQLKELFKLFRHLGFIKDEPLADQTCLQWCASPLVHPLAIHY